MYRAEAFNTLVEKYNSDPDNYMDWTEKEMIKKAEFVAKMRLAKENRKKSNSSQLSAF